MARWQSEARTEKNHEQEHEGRDQRGACPFKQTEEVIVTVSLCHVIVCFSSVSVGTSEMLCFLIVACHWQLYLYCIWRVKYTHLGFLQPIVLLDQIVHDPSVNM